MKTPNLFADNLVIQHLKRLPREEWGEEEVLHMYRELENLKQELSISSVVPCTIQYRMQLQYMYQWLNNNRLSYEEQRMQKARRQSFVTA